jgi:hypothetical protein
MSNVADREIAVVDEDAAAAELEAGVSDPLGNIVCLSRVRLGILQRDHPEVTAYDLWRTVRRPTEIREHSDRADRLVYLSRLPNGEPLLVFVQEEEPKRDRIVTAFAPEREDYYARTTGRRLW